MKRNLFTLLALALFVGVATGGTAAADDNRLAAVPFTFVGTAADCAPSPAGSQIVTAAWLAGMGLPDNGTSLNGAPGSANDPHFGLLLSKNGLTADCSSSGARIRGAAGMTVNAGFHLGFEQPPRVPPFLLGAIEGEIGAPHERLAALIAERHESDADRGGDLRLPGADISRLGQSLDDPAGERFGRRRLIGGALDDRELIAAEPRHHVIGPGEAFENGCRLYQHIVAGGVAGGVVNGLETV